MHLSPEHKRPASVTPLVSVIVPCRNEAVHIRQCIEPILQQHPVNGGFEVIVADGLSNDGTREVLEELARNHPEFKVVDNPLQITPCGMNAGIRASRGQWIAIMGAHNRYAPDYLARCLEEAERTGADNVGGAMRCEGKQLVQRAIAAAHHSTFAVGGARWHDPNFEGQADTVFGGFYRREIFDRIGLFDESLVRNQDDELNLRLTRAGGRIWHSPKIRSWYSPRSSLRALFRQYYQYGYWKVRVIQKHKLPASWRHLVPGAFVLGLAVLFLVSAFCLPWPVKSFAYFIGQLSAFSLLLTLSAYALCVLTASLITAARTEWKLLPVLPLVFPCYHFGYGYGFLRGIWDFIIRRKGAHNSFAALTR